MARSPLRYPGGKKKVLNLLAPFWKVPHDEYCEPFMGGGSVFLSKPKAPANWINDADKGIADLWTCMADWDANSKLRDMVLANSPPTVELWRMWRDFHPASVLDNAFRTLFLNRVCFSGIVKANPIGGVNQTGPASITSRWNPNLLCKQIEACYHILAGAKITSLDFEEVITVPGRNVFMYLDPPYYQTGNLLYEKQMLPEDHHRLSRLLKTTPYRFLLTYDDCPEIRSLYDGAYFYTCNWTYSIGKTKRKQGNELFISNFPMIKARQETFFEAKTGEGEFFLWLSG